MSTTITIDLTNPASVQWGLQQCGEAVVKLANKQPAKAKGVSADFHQKAQRQLSNRSRVFKAKS